MEWIPEKVLQRYVVENFSEFQGVFQKLFDQEIDYVRYNKPMDRYPDLFFVLKDKREIPVEVEWKTSNFDHPPDILLEQDGLIMVGKIEQDFDVGSIKQVEIPLEKFEKWFENNSKTLVSETTKSLHEIGEKRQLPKLWFTYLSQKGDAIEHFDPALRHGVWGIQKNYKFSNDTHIGGIKKDDLLVFLMKGKNFPGRIPLSDWTKKSFKGYFEKIFVCKVTSDYYFDETKIWKTNPNGKWKDELFPHRFNFNKNPIAIMKNIKVNKLGLSTKKELHNVVFTNFRMCDSHTLVDIFHNSTQLELNEMQNELKRISEL